MDKTKYISISDGIGDALGQIGPSILLTSLSECCCFAIGSISDMPAVKTFALYAAVAVLINFLLQMTAFVALMSFDQSRYMVYLSKFLFKPNKKKLIYFICSKDV